MERKAAPRRAARSLLFLAILSPSIEVRMLTSRHWSVGRPSRVSGKGDRNDLSLSPELTAHSIWMKTIRTSAYLLITKDYGARVNDSVLRHLVYRSR